MADECEGWRRTHMGRLLNNAVRRFETRISQLLIDAGYSHLRPSHISLTRNLDLEGTRITELARRAAMTKQAMSELVRLCEAIDLVSLAPDPKDGRAKVVTFTANGREWLRSVRGAVAQAEDEMIQEFGILRLDAIKALLASYGRDFDPLNHS